MDDTFKAALAAADVFGATWRPMVSRRIVGEDSERQWADVLGVLRLNADRLDLQLLRESADEVGVADLLARAVDVAATD